MKIAQSQIQIESSHILTEEQKQEESLRTWIGDARPDFSQEENTRSVMEMDRVTLSEEAFHQQFQRTSKPQPVENEAVEPVVEDPKLRAMRLILEALTGRKITIAGVEEIVSENSAAPPQEITEKPIDTERAGWGLEYDYYEMNAEHEQTNFSAQGMVLTQDGHEIQFTLDLAMQRDFVETEIIRIRAGDAVLVDPLVVNFDGTAAQLTDTKFNFDLDMDGYDEEISFVTPGSGFLILDKNNDGKVNNGSELFGPETGSGFLELAHLDSDANGWLDETDPIFDKLKIWIKDAAGTDYFASLKDKNIGAILLNHAATPFSIKDKANILLGQITDTGVFLRKNGTAGTVQEIDLAV